MALTPSEKQKRYRQKRDADKERRAEYLAKEKEKYVKDKQKGKRKLISTMSAREMRAQRKYWKTSKQSVRRRRKTEIDTLTLPSSPERRSNIQAEALSRQLSYSRKKIRRQKGKCYKDNEVLQSKVKAAYKKADMYRKRWMRIRDEKTGDTPNTPRKTTRNQMRSSTKTIKKTLLFHNVLYDQLTRACSVRNKRKALRAVLSGSILKKYRFKTFASRELGLSRQRNAFVPKGTLSQRLARHIEHFLERDDVSRQTTGSKRTLTKQKVKKQKRLLCDTLWNLHKKYASENKTKIGFSTFCRLRPFWVVPPTEADRDTCCCKKCENIKLIAEALNSANLIGTSNLEDLVKQVVCSTKTKACMYGNCIICKRKTVEIETKDQNRVMSWKQWKTVKEERIMKNGEKKTVTLTVKQEESGTASNLIDIFHDQMWNIYKRHNYNITNQFMYYRSLKEKLLETECFIHVDFAENYVGKMRSEIQSMHFGASQPQITLHTGYYKVGGNEGLVSFCGVSDSLQHEPASIWAFMTPILEEIKTKNPLVEYVHFYSDDPTSQYRQKANFYFLSTEVFELGFEGATWNFHEAGHGKGIPDGIGGSLKREADRCVRHGADIMDAMSFVEKLQEANTSVNLYIVQQDAINDKLNKIKTQNLKTIPGTMKLHQVVTSLYGHIRYRDVSCSCLEITCVGHNFQEFYITDTSKQGVKVKQTPSHIKRSENLGKHREVVKGDNYFFTCLKTLQNCSTFDELKSACCKLSLTEIVGTPRYILEEGLSVDHNAIDFYPEDVFEDKTRYPVTVRADGDCLPASGSVFAFGNDNHPDEIRLRIVVELALHKDYYLTDCNLKNGLKMPKKPGDIAKAFAMYSDEYIAGVHLTQSIIETIFEYEVLKITKPKSYMGVWQLFGLASVLQMPLFSVYPNLGNPVVRSDLHRLTHWIHFMEFDKNRHAPRYMGSKSLFACS